MGRNSVSGSVSLDVSGLATEIAAQTRQSVVNTVGHAIGEQMMPALAQVLQAIQSLGALLTSAGLGEADMAAALAMHLPSGTSTGGPTVRDALAQAQARALLDSGFLLVPASAPALNDTVQAQTPVPAGPPSDPLTASVDRHIQRQVEAQTDRSAEQGWRDETTGLVSGGLVTDEAAARADARLAQATRDGVADSWHEER